jgi:pimeloyl-ACP methyl ester carboxylesterase
MLLSHDVRGSGPTVLLLHAGVADRRMWAPLVDALAPTFRVVSPDLRGFGQTPLPPGPYSDADDLDALLAHLGIVRTAVVGSSYGGRVALELATTHPSRVSSLVLLNPAYRGIEPTGAAAAAGEEEDRLLEAGDVDGAVEHNVRTWLGPDAGDEARELVRVMQRNAFEVQLAADRADPGPVPRRVEVDPAGFTVPTTVVSGGHDLDHFPAVADHLAAQIPGADRVHLDWAGHLPSLERPDAVLALLLDVLREDPAVHAP